MQCKHMLYIYVYVAALCLVAHSVAIKANCGPPDSSSGHTDNNLTNTTFPLVPWGLRGCRVQKPILQQANIELSAIGLQQWQVENVDYISFYMLPKVRGLHSF